MIEIRAYSSDLSEFGDNDIVCYCFEYTRKDIENDYVVNDGRSTILERIILEKKAGGCDCAKKNPKGS